MRVVCQLNARRHCDNTGGQVPRLVVRPNEALEYNTRLDFQLAALSNIVHDLQAIRSERLGWPIEGVRSL